MNKNKKIINKQKESQAKWNYKIKEKTLNRNNIKLRGTINLIGA